MLFATALYTVLGTLAFYQLLRETKAVQCPLWSALISLFLPARYLIYHNVGATEAPFVFLACASMLAYVRGYYLLSFCLGGLMGITRITGILIGVVYFITLIFERKWRYIPWLALIGLPIFLTFSFYYYHFGDFFAYFSVNYSQGNKLIHGVPFLIFKVYSSSGNSHSAEFYLMMYAIYGAGVVMLWSINRLFFFYSLIMYLFSVFIFHQDIARYFIPIAPFALVVAFDKILSKNSVRMASVVFICLAYIYAWGMIPKNNVDQKTQSKLIEYLSE